MNEQEVLQAGPWTITSVVNGTIRLDGGAMFGVVPRVMWEGEVDVDDHHRILLATRTLMAVNSKAGRIVLVDTGCGSKWSVDRASLYGIMGDPTAISSALARHGATEEDVTDVVISHLHFDHNGGLTDWIDEAENETKLRYSRATHWIHDQHWRHAVAPHRKDRPSFLPRDFMALEESSLLRRVEGDGSAQGEADMTWICSGGHTPYQLHPVFGDDDHRVVFSGDIVPTSAHLSPGWVMAYDVEPMRTIEEKIALYDRCISEGLTLAFPHDPQHGFARVTGKANRPRLEAVIT
ncbi:MAG: MBL fold metallo-hydrolase [Planctomycetota bacterium]|jgi:glyoxylase-like metal-dependent hydrolase (beta-lactamase superfamily II)